MPSTSPKSYSGTMLAWSMAEVFRASSTKRSRNSASLVMCSPITFNATFRPSRTSVARYITLMPPRPSTPSIL